MNLENQERIGNYFGEDVECVRGFDPLYSWRLYADGTGWTGINVNGPLDLITTTKDKKFLLSQTTESYENKMSTGGARGTRIHTAAETGQTDHLQDPEKQTYSKLQEFIGTHRVSNVASEVAVRSMQYGYGGQFDRLGEFHSCNDNRCCRTKFEGLAVIDWKTSRVYRQTNGFQLGAYWYPVAKQYPKENVGMIIVQATPERVRPFIYEHQDYCFHKFLCQLEVWKGVPENFNKLRWLNAPMEVRKMKQEEREAARIEWSPLYQWQYLDRQAVVRSE